MMMSRLLSKLSYRSNVLMHKERLRMFSTSPYLTLCVAGNEPPIEGGDCKGDVLLFDAAKEDLLAVRDKILPREIVNWKLIGATNGWGFFSDHTNHNSVFISDLFSPLASKTTIKILPLPHLTTMLYGQTQVVWNVAMSQQDTEDEDCVVALNFLGRQLSMCRPCRGGDVVGWTNKYIPIACSEKSNLMFSKRDQRFYLPASGGNCLCSWGLDLDKEPEFHELVFRDLPEFPQDGWEVLDSCFRDNHWVESPSGESFLIKWYSDVPHRRFKDQILMVFREDREGGKEEGKRVMRYTEDIGDLCIFLSSSEPLCVAASSCPGLKPNSIYMIGRYFGVHDLATGNARCFKIPNDTPEEIPLLPYWLLPFST